MMPSGVKNLNKLVVWLSLTMAIAACDGPSNSSAPVPPAAPVYTQTQVMQDFDGLEGAEYDLNSYGLVFENTLGSQWQLIAYEEAYSYSESELIFNLTSFERAAEQVISRYSGTYVIAENAPFVNSLSEVELLKIRQMLTEARQLRQSLESSPGAFYKGQVGSDADAEEPEAEGVRPAAHFEREGNDEKDPPPDDDEPPSNPSTGDRHGRPRRTR